jgi:membrane associated rhomboid family serine protease
MRLVIANVAVFGLQTVMPELARWGVFTPRLAFVQPWTFVTYMFLHGGLGHLFFNMLGLFFFGSRVEARMGGTRFIQLYFVAGITGALLSLVLSPNAGIIGASGGVFGVMMAFAAFWPRDRIYIWGVLPVEAWLLVGLTTLFALFSGLTGSSGGTAHFAHLGGYVGAYLYLLALDRFSPSKQFKAKVAKVAPTTEKALKANWRNVNLEGVHQLSREEVNRILDKINAEGMGSLSAEEKLFLSNFVPPDDRKSWTS